MGMSYLFVNYMQGFNLGVYLFILVFLLNFTVGIVYINVHRAVFRPKNDPGLKIWWLCCIRVGMTGKFLKENTKKKIAAKISKKNL